MKSSKREKIEFWLNAGDKTRFHDLCKRAGYTIAETMRRAVEEKMDELSKKVGDQ